MRIYIHLYICIFILGEIPLCSQENYLIEDLLNILVGLEGCYIEPKPLVDPWGPREFAIDESVDISLSELVRQILPLASHYSLMRRFMEEKIQFEYGQVNNALCCALHQYLVEHSVIFKHSITKHYIPNDFIFL